MYDIHTRLNHSVKAKILGAISWLSHATSPYPNKNVTEEERMGRREE
jgi:hypothetical protein